MKDMSDKEFVEAWLRRFPDVESFCDYIDQQIEATDSEEQKQAFRELRSKVIRINQGEE